MSSTRIVKTSLIDRSARVMQMEGMFDVPPTQRSEVTWDVSLPLEDFKWNVGLIVGPSGSGKTTVARELFEDHIVTGFDWPADKSILDAFPPRMSIKEITGVLSSVGFSSPPAWLRPFHVLSNGEQFRVTMARALTESKDLVVMDEFTSVVDRTVARIGSAAVAKSVRRQGRRFIAISCHYDIVDWLEPDWVYEPHTARFARDCLQRPDIEITVRRVHRDAWRLFKHHHYLDTSISPASHCFCGFVDGVPAAFTAVLSFPHPVRSGWREHRTVCLPDYQGVGIGNTMSAHIAGIYRATGKPYWSTTSSPAMIYHRARSPIWKMVRKPSRASQYSKTAHQGLERTKAMNRLTASFEFVGEPLTKQARGFGLL